jgi:hypothetical protein
MVRRRVPTVFLLASLTAFVATTYVVATEEQSGGANRLTVKPAVHHVDRLAREPMIVEHPHGELFVSGYGGAPVRPTLRDVPFLWKSSDAGATWRRVEVGRAEDGALGNSDVDLAVAPDGTLYFVTMVFDMEGMAGHGIHIGVSRDVGATWKWTRLSETRYDDRPWVEVAPNGTAHVIWNDGDGISHAVSDNRGASWTERPKIHDQGGSSHLAIGPAGEIAVRITPVSASGFKHHPDADFIAISSDGGKTWRKTTAPGERQWTFPHAEVDPLPRWVEPIAWDAAGSLFYLWTDPAGVRLARSRDDGRTWQQWSIAESKGATAYYPYLVARGRGELAATWFSAKLPDTSSLPTHIAKIQVGDGNDAPEVLLAPPFQFDAFGVRESSSRTPAGEYVPVIFLRGGLGVVTPIQDTKGQRFGFSWWRVE